MSGNTINLPWTKRMKIKDTTLPMNNLPTPMAKSVKNASKTDMVSFLGSFGYWGFGVLRYDNLLIFFYFKVRIRENEKNLKPNNQNKTLDLAPSGTICW